MSKKNLSPIDADFAGIFFKPIAHYLENPDVAEVMVNAHDDIWVEDNDGLRKVPEVFTPDALVSAVNSLAQYVGRPLQEHVFSIDARMPDGSRVCIVLPPVSGHDPIFAIRRFKEVVSDLDFLVAKKSLSPEMVEFIDACVKIKKNIMVSGGTSSGKTTLLNLIAAKIPDEDRIITIEDSRELQLQQEHVLSLEGKPADKHGRGEFPIRHCLKSTLRLRPDRIIVGEIRSGEAFDLVQAMNTGHGGCMGTVHANAPTDTLRRIESLALMADVDMPLIALRSMIASALDLIICPARLSDGSRRIVQIAEIGALTEKGDYTTVDICKFVSTKRNRDTGKIEGYFEFTGHVPSFFDMFEAEGVPVPVEFFRKRVMGEVPDDVVPKLLERGYEVPGHNAPAAAVLNPAPIQEKVVQEPEPAAVEPQFEVPVEEPVAPVTQNSFQEEPQAQDISQEFPQVDEPAVPAFDEQAPQAFPTEEVASNISLEQPIEQSPVNEIPQSAASFQEESVEPIPSSFDDMNQQVVSPEQPVMNFDQNEQTYVNESFNQSMPSLKPEAQMSQEAAAPQEMPQKTEAQQKPSILERLSMLGGSDPVQSQENQAPESFPSEMPVLDQPVVTEDPMAQAQAIPSEFGMPEPQMPTTPQEVPAQEIQQSFDIPSEVNNPTAGLDEYQTSTSMNFEDESTPSPTAFAEQTSKQPEFNPQPQQETVSFDDSQLNQNVNSFPQGQVQEFNQSPVPTEQFSPMQEPSFQEQPQAPSFNEFETSQPNPMPGTEMPAQGSMQPQMQQQEAAPSETKQHAVIAEILKRMRENKASEGA